MKILVIDDEPFALKLIGRQLANLGFTDVLLHQNAYDGLAEFENSVDSIDLVLCDLQMPDIDGVECMRHLARIGYAGGVVLVSGEDERILHAVKNLAQAHELNILGFLFKPILPAQLQELLGSKSLRAAKVPRTSGNIYKPEELHRAITNGELINYYQPKVEFNTGRVAGVETLVRWQHPEDGLILPSQFITLAEEEGFIDDLTRTVLSAALSQARQWRDAGLDLHLAVNISMTNLTSLNFPDDVMRQLNNVGILPTDLVLEVTESRLMQNPLTSLEILTRLRLKKLGLSIDDFGTGHSSLAQLRDVPFNELKIDRSFVHGAWRDTTLQVILEASIGMAWQLGVKTVAEGIEDRDDWNYLRAAGCSLAQGYFIAHPMPAESLDDWLIDWEARRSELVKVA